jgi:hypothetical protein
MSANRETEARFVRSDSPHLSAEANAALSDEAREAIGAERVRVPVDAPDAGRHAHGDHTHATAQAASMRPVFLITGLSALTIGAIVALATGSWWALVAAAGVHALGTILTATGAIQLTTQTEHASPATTALLEREGVADPDRALTDLVEDYTGAGNGSPTAGVVSGADTASSHPAAERRALTPGHPAAGDGSAVEFLPWWIMGGLLVVTLAAAIVEGGKMWLAPGILVPVGAIWITLDRYLAGDREHDRAGGRSRLLLVGGCTVGAVVLFVAVMQLVAT